MEVITSNQHLSLARAVVASTLNMAQNHVHAHIKRLGGGFGGKESRYDLLKTGDLCCATKHCSLV